MNEAYEQIAGSDPGVLVVVDHASNRVPADIDLGVDASLLEKHIAWDIGAAAVGRALCERLSAAGVFGNVSRLVLDLHRELDSPGLVPVESDGYRVPGNQRLRPADRQARIDRFWHPYHANLAAIIEDQRPDLIVAVHSFTPRLKSAEGADRPWEVGILYNDDDRAARVAIEALRHLGLPTGDNQPYSGKLLNATMNMHAEARGIPYLAIEIRNDLICDDTGIDRWAYILESVISICRNKLAQDRAQS